jgi:sulfite reductase alpha subunit-like flavoprotein
METIRIDLAGTKKGAKERKKEKKKKEKTEEIELATIIFFFVKIFITQLLSYTHFRHIEFEIGDNLKYEAGDHLGVFPENTTSLVEQLAARLGADLNQVIALVPTESSLPANLNIFTCFSFSFVEVNIPGFCLVIRFYYA